MVAKFPVLFQARKMKIVLVILLFMLCIWDLYLYTQPNKRSNWYYLFNVGYATVYGLGGVLGLGAVVRLGKQTSIGKATIYLSIALVSYAIGLYIWAYYNIIARIEIPFPSIADFFFVMYIPSIAIGFYYLLKLFSTVITKRVVGESIGVILVITVCIFTFFLNTNTLESQSELTSFLNLFYPLGDVLLISLAFIALRLGGGKISSSILFFIVGLLLQAAADLVFGYRTSHNIYWNGDISDLLYTFSGFTLTWGLLNTVTQFL